MPFIRGRFHINPIAGQALEAARAAEEALAELEQDADGVLADSADSHSSAARAASSACPAIGLMW